MAKQKQSKLQHIQISVTVLPAQDEYLRKLKKETGQTASETCRRALEEYIASHPLIKTEV